MQTVSATLDTALLAHEAGDSSFALSELIEIYSSSYVPHAVNGYEPSVAEKRFCGILGFTFLTLAYEREFVDRGDVQKFMGKAENNVTLNFSNISRQLAAWVQATEIEGKQLVIRVVANSSTVLADSLVIFTGRLDKPGDFSDESGSLSATQRFGQINQQFPPRTFSPNDPNGRSPSDPLFEGFRFSAQTASVIFTTRERRQGFGGLVGLTKKVTHSFQASSHTGVTADLAVPDSFGRVQVYGTYLATIDIGNSINLNVAIGEGPIAEFIDVKQVNPKFTQVLALRKRYGYLGNQGPVGREQVPIKVTNPEANVPGDGYYSRTAWFHGFVNGSTPDIDEAEAPDWIILVKAKIIKTPDGSGVFNTDAWTDNPAYIARHLLADSRYFNEGESAIEDPVCWNTGLHCAGYVLDSTKGEWAFIPQADAPLHGIDFSLYRSTGLVDARRVRMLDLGSLAGDPFLTLAEIEPFDPGDPPDPDDIPTNPNLRPTVLRVRHTCNLTLLERMSGLDFLFNVVAPTGRLFFRRNGKGKIEIHSERPADNTRLRTALSGGATTVPITDIDPWKTGLLLTQKLLIGNTLTTSEVRVVTAANYTADGNNITLGSSGSGGITATASGANLTGGSSSVPASGTVTLGGSAAGIVTVTINGIACSYNLDSFDSLASAAILLSRFINATPRLNAFVKASASGSVVTITAKWGVLTLNSSLANSHSAEVASPTVAPVGAPGSGGALVAGTYRIGYAWRTAVGQTAISPLTSNVVTANQLIAMTAVTPLPPTVLSVDWYVSKYANSTELVFYANNNGTTFNISAMPVQSNDLPPDLNESGEEILRVAMSFSSNDQGSTVLTQTGLTRGNIHAGSFKWPLPGKQSSTNQLIGTFYDSTDDYAPSPIEVNDYGHQLQIRKTNKKEVDLSGFDNYSQSSRQLNHILSKHREGDWFNTLSAGPYAMLLEEGDITCASSDNGGLINVVTRAEEISIGPAPTFTTKITGRKYSTRMFSDNVRQHSIRLPTTLRAITPLPTIAQFIDNYPIRDMDGLSPGFYFIPSFDVAAQGSWRGWKLWADYGDGYAPIAEGDVAVVKGTATTTLGTVADPSVWDRTNTLTFTLLFYPLDSEPFATVAEQDLLENPRRNLFLVGDEYLQAAIITNNSNHSYTISTLLRGRFGTDNSTNLAHGASERVVYLDGSEKFVGIDVTRLNGVFNYKAVTVNQDVSAATAVPFSWTGGNLRPLSPVNLRGTRDTLGNLLIEWTRRSRLSPGMVPGSDVPLSEEVENYDVEILTTGNVLKRTMNVSSGGARAAVLVNSEPTAAARVSGNNIIAGTGTSGAAYATQFLTESGCFVEATLKVPSGTGFGQIFLVPDYTATAWNSFIFPANEFYRNVVNFTPSNTSFGNVPGLKIVEGGVIKFNPGPLAPSIMSVRIRVLISGSEVRYYWDYTGPGSVPFYISRIAPPPAGCCCVHGG